VPRVSTLSLLFDLFVASQRVGRLLADAMTDVGLRPDEYAVYSAVFDLGPISPTDLARALGMPPTTVSHYMEAMRAAGHVRQVRNPRDGRSYLVRLSLEGLAAHRQAHAGFNRAYQALMSRLDDPVAAAEGIRAVGEAAQGAIEELTGEVHAARRAG
jgi:DNA-binding MarR family transcriptional regulator